MKRFASINERPFQTDLSRFDNFDNFVERVKISKNAQRWGEYTLMKDPFTLAIYSQFLQELSPKTIVEFGSGDGGSGKWMKDMLGIFENECRVITFDNQDYGRMAEGLEFYNQDLTRLPEDIEKYDEMFRQMLHPVLFVEDSHVSVRENMEIMDRYLIKGDYVVIEDTLALSVYQEMVPFLQTSQLYLVDTKFSDWWGYNMSWNVNSFLIKAYD